jgi:uncharacterized repeat protein (TIGR01451 family)
MFERRRPKGEQMRRVGACETGSPGKHFVPFRHVRVTLGIALALALSVPTVASAATITVDEQAESATFVNGGDRPANYFDSIKDLSNHNGKCSLRESIEASNTNAKVDGCAAGSGPGDVVEVPAGEYPVFDNLFVRQRVIVRGANAGTPGSDPQRGPETVITFVNNPHSQAQVGMFWLGNPAPRGPADGGGSEFDGLTLAGNSNPLCKAVPPSVAGTCEEWAIVQPEKSGGGPDTAPGVKLRNSIVRDFTSGVYVGGRGAVIAGNLFKDNSALFGDPRGVNSGVDVYSDGIYTNLDPVVVRNVFANPAVSAVEYQGINGGEEVSGGLIRGNLVNMHRPAAVPPGTFRFAMLLLDTHRQRVQDNVIRDADPPQLDTRIFPYGVFLDSVTALEISGNTFTGLGAALRVSHIGAQPDTGATNVRVANNRIYGNRFGVRVSLQTPLVPLAIDARANWWGANGGPGSTGARPGAANPVNGLRFEAAGLPVPNPGGIDTTNPLQLTCSMPAIVTANTPVPLTGSVVGMPSVDRAASASPWFESIHDPLMAASVSGVPGTTSGFDRPASQGVSRGQVITGGGSLTGTLVATAAGAGAGRVALDSEQVPCPFRAAPEDVVIEKTTQTRSARPGALITYRITVTNRGAAPVLRLRSCDRAPRALRLVRATARLQRAAGGRRCLVIPLLRPGERRTFAATFRLRANVTAATVTNGASADVPTGSAPSAAPPNGAGSPVNSADNTLRPVAKAKAAVRVRGKPRPQFTG